MARAAATFGRGARCFQPKAAAANAKPNAAPFVTDPPSTIIISNDFSLAVAIIVPIPATSNVRIDAMNSNPTIPPVTVDLTKRPTICSSKTCIVADPVV